MQQPHDVESFSLDEVEDQVGKRFEPQRAQARNVQLKRKAQRTELGVCLKPTDSSLKLVNELSRHTGTGLSDVIRQRLLDVALSC